MLTFKRIAKLFALMLAFVCLAALVASCDTAPSAPTAMPGMDMTAQAAAVSAATPSAPHHALAALLPPAANETTKKITLEVKDARLEVAPGVVADLWTFNGSVPGPMLHVRQGDTIDFTLVNHGTTSHSIDFHAAQTPWDVNYQPVAAGATAHFTFKANYPGVFMYHCGTPPVLAHLAMGMYGLIVVDPAEPLPKADREYALVQSELYLKMDNHGVYQSDYNKAVAATPDYVVFNGFANQYGSEPLTANPGERVRLYVMNAGPTTTSAFHVIGALFDKVYPGNSAKNAISGEQTYNIPPGGGVTFDLVMPDKGLYPFVTHAFAYTGKGALGLFNVGDAPMPNTPTSH